MSEQPRQPRPPNVDTAAFAPPDPNTPHDRDGAHRPPLGDKRSVVVKIHENLLGRLRDHCAARRMSVTEAVLSAHLEIGENVQQTLRPTDADKARIALGLPPLNSRSPLGPGKPLSLWLGPAALAELDAGAMTTDTTRRRYVTELLTALLTPSDPPAEHSTETPQPD